MPSALLTAGAQLDKPSKNAPLHINRFFTGLWTNRSPLREGGVPYLYEKFYSGARFDSVFSGQNTELTTRLTWARRPGSSVYNSQLFPGINTFYDFHVTDPYTGTPSIRVIADAPLSVYDATGPSTKTVLFTKGAGAGQTSFQSVGNTLYAGDGVETWKWIWAPAWKPNTVYSTGNVITDSNNNLQAVSAIKIFATPFNPGFPTTPNVQVVSNIGRVYWSGVFTDQQINTLTGAVVSFSGFTGATFLNGTTVALTAVLNDHFGNATIQFNILQANYGPAADVGIVTFTPGSATSGASTPSWSPTIGGQVVDNNVLVWTNKGPMVENWGIKKPISAPTVSNILNTNLGSSWAASTYYSPSLCIVDSNSNIQLLTTAGTTGGSVPTWATGVGATTTDGSAVWTNQGSATRLTSSAYSKGAIIAVQYSYTVTIKVPIFDGRAVTYNYQTLTYGPYYYFFQASVGGNTGTTATTNISWQTTPVTDGTVSWVNIGPWITRTSSATSGGTSTVKGNIGNSQVVSTIITIIDSNGNSETVMRSGLSGSSAPAWATASGSNTTDNQITWVNQGPATAANTGAWQYGYAFMNSVTGDISTMSPTSTIITLGAASLIAISGSGDPNYATDGVDTIVIYRTVQGGSASVSGGTFFQLTTIPASALGGPWSYQDNSPDPPATGSILNVLISADVTGTNAPPPSNILSLAYHLGRVWGSSLNNVIFSQPSGASVGVGAESFPGGNFMAMPSTPTVLWPASSGIFIYTNSNIWVSTGTDSNGNPLKPFLYLGNTGLLSPNCFTVNGSLPTIFASDSTAQVLDPAAGVQWVGLPIGDKLQTFSPSSAYVTWHSFGLDQAYYIADGGTGWYRLAPLSPPESGYAWSTFGTIATGVKCVKSIETSPGVRTLLLGPSVNGPILKRDATINQDNGTSYLANIVIGSIVLAQPNQCAEVVSLTTETAAVGSRVTVSILADEINGTFESLASSVPDPPFLPPSQSLYVDRWYFEELQPTSPVATAAPAWMRHLMISFAWPAENFANELYSYSIYGSIHTEG